MIKFNVPVDFTVYARDTVHVQEQIDLFLKQAFREFSASYNVMDYEVPYGYPLEGDKKHECICTGHRDTHAQ